MICVAIQTLKVLYVDFSSFVYIYVYIIEKLDREPHLVGLVVNIGSMRGFTNSPAKRGN